MVAARRGERFIFIGGTPRSGTTLVQNMLDSHPDVWGGPEFLHLHDIIVLRNKMLGSISRKWIDMYCSAGELDELLRSIIERLFLPLADQHNCRFLSEKSPQNVLIFSELLELFPGAKLIHVVRDPRAIVSSLLRVGIRAEQKGVTTAGYTRTLKAAVVYTKKCFAAGFGAAKRTPDKILTLRYEQLVCDPATETKRICRFLGIEWTEQMLHPESFRHPGEAAITTNSGEIWYDKESFSRKVERSDVDKWKTYLSAAQQVAIARSFRNDDSLVESGYDLLTDNLSKVSYAVGFALNAFDRVVHRIFGGFRAVWGGTSPTRVDSSLRSE